MSNRQYYWFALIVGLVINIPVPSDPRTTLWGHPLGEAINHYWMFWRFFQEDVVCNWPAGLELPLMDPTNLIFYGIGHLLDGPVLAYNAILIANIALAYVGGVRLARCFGDEKKAILSGFFLCSTPIFWATRQFGITEAMGIGWLALFCSFAFDGKRKAKFLPALFLAAYFGCGIYSIIFGTAVFMCLLFLRWQGESTFYRPLKYLMIDFVTALSLSSPLIWQAFSAREIWYDRISTVSYQYRPDWLTHNYMGADFFSIFIPIHAQDGPTNSVFLGYAFILLTIYGLFRLKRSWTIALLVLFFFTLGPFPRIAGWGGVPSPLWYLQSIVPYLDGIQHWHRLVLVLSVLCLPAITIAINRLGHRTLILFGIFTVVELFVNRHDAEDGFIVEVPEMYTGISQSVLLEMPLSYSSEERRSRFYRTSNLWQPLHENPVSINYEKEVYLLKNKYLSYLNRLCLKPVQSEAPPESDWLAYWDLLVVSRIDCPNYLGFVAELTPKIGVPVKQTDEHLMWENPRRNNYD